jgi:hypothetical protein
VKNEVTSALPPMTTLRTGYGAESAATDGVAMGMTAVVTIAQMAAIARRRADMSWDLLVGPPARLGAR